MKQTRFKYPYHRATHRHLVRTILLPVIVVSILTALVVPLVIGYSSIRSNLQNNRKLNQSFVYLLSRYRSGMETLANDPLIIEFLKSGENRIDTCEKIYSFRNKGMDEGSNEIKAAFQLISYDQSFYVADYPYPDTRDFDLKSNIMLHRRLISLDSVVIHAVYKESANPNLFVMAINIAEEDNDLGALAIIIPARLLQLDLRDNSQSVIVTDQNSQVVYANNVSFAFRYRLFQPEHLFSCIYRIEGAEYILHGTPVPDSDLTLYTLVSFSFLSPLLSGGSIVVLMVLLLVAIIYGVSFQTTRAMMEPFDSIFSVIEDYYNKGMLARLELNTNDEYYPYFYQFNRLLDRIEQLLKDNLELVSQTKTAEMKNLYSQFNPHFIFNVLETIKYIIYDDPEQADRMIIGLSKILRYTLEQSEKGLMILEEDMEYIEEYLNLYQKRLGDGFTYQILLAQETLCCLIPRLIVLPVIENSMKHGYREAPPFHLEIKTECYDELLIITVSDNGKGMQKEALERLKVRMERKENDDEHIGLFNSHRRLQLHYGDHYGLEIHSHEGQGTTVRLLLRAVSE